MNQTIKQAVAAEKFSLEEARKIARELLGLLSPYVERIQIAGSIRREKPMVKDIELLYVPKFGGTGNLFGDERENLTDRRLDELLLIGVLAQRANRVGRYIWGDCNKRAQHVQSGIPVDLFATNNESWWNYLVCRTGGAESNIAICQAAQAKGWKWNPYGEGFTQTPEDAATFGRPIHEGNRRVYTVQSEREVFEFVGLTYKEPNERG